MSEKETKLHKHFIGMNVNVNVNVNVNINMNINMKYKIHQPIPPEIDVIFQTIAKRIIQRFDSNESRYAIPRYQNPEDIDLFQITTDGSTKELCEKIEEINIWKKIIERVSPEIYTSRLLLYVMCKRPIPLFSSKNTFRIKQLIKELDNRFSSPKIREELINHFCKFKQIYWAFTKLARIWKISKTPMRIQTDLYMNELDPKNPLTFQLVHPNGIYLFSLHNLARIVVDAITHQSGMFLEPLYIKNPYTNGLLSKCDLFNIYISLRTNHLRIHEMLEKFFRCEFNAFEFRRKHETELRDLAIDQYAKTANISELAQDVDDMLRLHKMSKKINIAKGFPQNVLVETMRPFLKIYLLERYSFSSMTRKYSAKQLDLKLKHFTENNPNYGKKMEVEFHVPLDSNPFSPTQQYIKQPAKYITETISHANYCKLKYMETHIYDEDVFDRYIETGDSLNTYMEPIPEPEFPSEIYESEIEWSENAPQSPLPLSSLLHLDREARSPTTPFRLLQLPFSSGNTLVPNAHFLMESPTQLNYDAFYEENSRIQENTREIISRFVENDADDEEEEEEEEVIQDHSSEYDTDLDEEEINQRIEEDEEDDEDEEEAEEADSVS